MSMLLQTIVALVLLAILWMWFRSRRSYYNMPPGEWGWPVVGYIPPSNESLEDTVKKMQSKHGDIITWRIGSRLFVILCKYSTIKQIFNHPDVQDRPNFYSFRVFSKQQNLGVFNVSGKMWETSRRFTIRHLRNLGMGRSSLEVAIAAEASLLVEDYKKYTDKPTPLPMSISVAILNVIWKMTSDRRFELDDPAIQKFQQMVIGIFVEASGNVVLFDMFPYLVSITPRFLMTKLGVTSYEDKCHKFMDYIQEVVEEHKATLDPDNPRDFIDAFLVEMRLPKNIDNPCFTDDNLIVSVGDIFTAGSETTSTTLRWIFQYLAKYPNIQAKLQEEIDQFVPRDRLPTLEDRDNLNYTEAVFHECQRFLSVANFAAPHVNTVDLTVDGYTIPKDTIIYGNATACHNDPEYWAKPDEIYPEHFLDQEGKFLNKKDGYLPFSIGRRVCPGEVLAKMVIYLIGAALLQNFTFSAPEGVTVSIKRDPAHKFFAIPKPVDFVIRYRK